MANPHRYGFRFLKNRWGGDTPEIHTGFIASGYTPNVTGATTCNLNIGDPVKQLNDGSFALLTPGELDDDDADERCYGVIAGFPQVLINGAVRPNAYYPTNTVYGTNLNNQTLVQVIPAEGCVWEIDTATTSSSFDTKAEFQAVIGAVARIVYSQLNTGTINPKANPMLELSFGESTVVRQCRVVGLGRGFEQYDLTLANVPLQVVFNQVQASPWRTAGGQE
jgi:hypothetical protein